MYTFQNAAAGAEAELAGLGLRMPDQPTIELDSIFDTASGVVHGWPTSLEEVPSEDLGAWLALTAGWSAFIGAQMAIADAVKVGARARAALVHAQAVARREAKGVMARRRGRRLPRCARGPRRRGGGRRWRAISIAVAMGSPFWRCFLVKQSMPPPTTFLNPLRGQPMGGEVSIVTGVEITPDRDDSETLRHQLSTTEGDAYGSMDGTYLRTGPHAGLCSQPLPSRGC